ncbi:hypothetical protein NQ314_014512 [Rhamnusium bicolor]|uniref:Elongation of very long chain fatty acids protein n=1 Tax=Rhamnusium bicolor TaxID=1586634 RepID=A0AAV8X248_9CUCU|nr:hypothetical protein NQ314_014512 [Rhamnusium bicolor]
MALLLKKLYTGYYWIFDELSGIYIYIFLVSDPRNEELGLILMSSPIKPVLVITSYMYFIYNLGPKLMANRKPFNLKVVLILYNLAQVLLNLHIAIVSFEELWYHTNWDCELIDYSSSPRAIYIFRKYHLFFLIKMIDLLDTVSNYTLLD